MASYQANHVPDTTGFHNDAELLGKIARRSEYVSFQDDDAQLEIPVVGDSLTRFVGLRVQALIRPASITRRFNIAEGWGSFAFFIESDGRLMGTINDGQNWVGVDSGSNKVAANTWSRVSFEYDGVSISKLQLNGSIVGRRLDMSYQMRQPQAVIALGHWPRGDGRYTLKGDLGHVRIERRDYEDFWRDAMRTAFCRRRLTPLQADARREIFYLFSTIDPAEQQRLRECAIQQSERLRALLHKLRTTNPRQIVHLRKLGERLRTAWCCSFNAPAARDGLLEYFRTIAGAPGSQARSGFNADVEEFLLIGAMGASWGYPYDRIRELCLVLFPELRTFELDFREIASSV
jgi:hypothetical protein